MKPQHCDVATPLNLDQFELLDVPNMHGNSLDHPTETSMFFANLPVRSPRICPLQPSKSSKADGLA
jgi:hypothetical protein